VLRVYVQVFDMNPRVPAPRGIVIKVQRKSDRRSRIVLNQLRDEAVEAPGVAEAIAKQIGLGRVNGVGLALIFSEIADERENLRHVGRSCGANVEGGGYLHEVLITA